MRLLPLLILAISTSAEASTPFETLRLDVGMEKEAIIAQGAECAPRKPGYHSVFDGKEVFECNLNAKFKKSGIQFSQELAEPTAVSILFVKPYKTVDRVEIRYRRGMEGALLGSFPKPDLVFDQGTRKYYHWLEGKDVLKSVHCGSTGCYATAIRDAKAYKNIKDSKAAADKQEAASKAKQKSEMDAFYGKK